MPARLSVPEEIYVRALRLLAEHYHKPPDQITEEELRHYFLHIKNLKKWSRAGITIALGRHQVLLQENPQNRLCLATIYSCGLLLKEGTHLQECGGVRKLVGEITPKRTRAP